MPNTSEAYGLTTITVYDQFGDLAYKKGGNPVSFDLVTKDLDMGDRQVLKYVDALLLELQEYKNLNNIETAQIENRDNLEDLPQETALDLNRGWEPIFLRLSGRFFKIRLQSEGADVFFRLGFIEMYGNQHGRRL